MVDSLLSGTMVSIKINNEASLHYHQYQQVVLLQGFHRSHTILIGFAQRVITSSALAAKEETS